jgi:hypothetical protein
MFYNVATSFQDKQIYNTKIRQASLPRKNINVAHMGKYENHFCNLDIILFIKTAFMM